MRIGHGVDVHPFSAAPDRPLVLGGVRFAEGGGLAGHSDADAVAHAVIDALLGAAGLGDIGQLFPDDDPRLAGADSVELLRHAVGLVRAAGWQPANVDCTVMTEAPRLAPRRAEMERRLGDVVGAPVTVKGKRAEGLGTLGRREGLACWAVALLTRYRSGSVGVVTARGGARDGAKRGGRGAAGSGASADRRPVGRAGESRTRRTTRPPGASARSDGRTRTDGRSWTDGRGRSDGRARSEGALGPRGAAGPAPPPTGRASARRRRPRASAATRSRGGRRCGNCWWQAGVV